MTKQNGFIDNLILFDGEDYDTSTFAHSKDVLMYQCFMDYGTETNTFTCEPLNMHENVVLILCSSGTTGLPKGVQLTQFNILVANIQH